MRNAFLWSVVIALIVFSGCSQPKEVTLLLEKDESVSLRSGQILNVELRSNPTTGYGWSVLSSDTSGVLNQLGETTYEPSDEAKSGMVGAGGIQTYGFSAVKKGKVIIVFQYSRPWEKEVEPIKRLVLQVTVSD